MSKRLYFNLFYPYVKEQSIKRAVVLMGPRRVGKTVMMFHAINELIEEQVNPQQIIFVGIDNPMYMHLALEEILLLCKEALKLQQLTGCYGFFYEIQYLKDWERHLQVIVDSYPEIKFVVSGSAAAALKWHSTESGADRSTDFMLPPLTFQEYIHLKQMNHLIYINTEIFSKVFRMIIRIPKTMAFRIDFPAFASFLHPQTIKYQLVKNAGRHTDVRLAKAKI